ncbi:GNAT family N-acetyltransferase [Staphylococcus sp. GSSP0090]|nr:GNAT family N-acetyltransferase [Staphylococcus sp. GSSP0090]
MTIRCAKENELKRINQVIPKVFEEAMMGMLNLSDASLRDMSNQLLMQGAKYYVLIEDHVFKGFVLIDEKTDDFIQQSYGFIYELYVFETYRRQGVAEKLIDFVNGYFKSQEIDEVRLNVHVQNKAKLLYEKMGFQERNVTMSMNFKK